MTRTPCGASFTESRRKLEIYFPHSETFCFLDSIWIRFVLRRLPFVFPAIIFDDVTILPPVDSCRSADGRRQKGGITGGVRFP